MRIALAIIVDPLTLAVLVGRRPAGSHLEGLWEFPGGKVEPPESDAAAAAREAWEETGLAVDILEAWPVVEHRYDDRVVALHPFLCAPAARELGEPLPPWRWIAGGALGDYPFPAANAPLLARLRAGWSRGDYRRLGPAL